MFFPRLRRHAKWVFLFLALAFGLGFVAFGVGAGGVGFGDIFRGAGNSGIPSVSSARERVNENPKDAKAWRDLATALQAQAETDEAIEALQGYVALRPKDEDALRELAALYLVQLGDAQREYQLAQLRIAYLATSGSYFQSISLGGQPLDLDPISAAVSSSLSTDTTAALSKAQAAASSSVETYRKIAALRPDDPSIQLQLGDAAASAGDSTTAIQAYKKYLALVPADDPTVRRVESLIKQLSAGAPG
jgi:regulator of sirC expression with transglutaminase-like and TPR domain